MLEEHIHHLWTVFGVFSSIGISINPVKSFIGFPLIQLLGQYIDSLGLSIATEKLEAIANLEFLRTL
jgi:hypothetical protein